MITTAAGLTVAIPVLICYHWISAKIDKLVTELDELAHRVLTENIADTEQVLALVAREISTSTYLNLMEQYHPCYRAWENPPLDRPPRAGEFETAMAIAWK